MARGRVTLELDLNEYKVIAKALDNYKGRLIHLTRTNEGNYEEYCKLIDEEKILDKITKDFSL